MPRKFDEKRPGGLHIFVRHAGSEYLDKCARIRNISKTALLRRLLEAITRDELVPSILDDEGDIKRRRAGEHRFKEPKEMGQ